MTLTLIDFSSKLAKAGGSGRHKLPEQGVHGVRVFFRRPYRENYSDPVNGPRSATGRKPWCFEISKQGQCNFREKTSRKKTLTLVAADVVCGDWRQATQVLFEHFLN
ncbi:hypothetical protein QN362_15595 [Actimicrobium sp. CCC2.4]|uniref:hypothetical protein n=1 Tax=Actimicrobium sp. CCC2.4 TaxID=3048606 RepID=UPI002B249B10|nr:hypothetical protein [Actimicrobium sp. CCC2.4]MEB0136761.1 hypothetical protein [Actimicrobium sp. CCC2.4]